MDLLRIYFYLAHIRLNYFRIFEQMMSTIGAFKTAINERSWRVQKRIVDYHEKTHGKLNDKFFFPLSKKCK